MIPGKPISGSRIEQSIKDEAGRLGFVLAGFTTPEAPPHFSVFEQWLMQGRHASMHYLANDLSRSRRADPRLVMPECRSILMLAVPYTNPNSLPILAADARSRPPTGRVASYAWGADYHLVLPERLAATVAFIERQVGHAVSSRVYTDTGPILERDLAQRAGLGWIGKNTCLINPRRGSCFLLAEILLDLYLEPDAPFQADRCGTCTRCIDACPTACILPDRTLDAGRCISFLTIELKEGIPTEIRPAIGNWIFGCDVCQMVCPWNRFAPVEGDAAFRPAHGVRERELTSEIMMSSKEFSQRFQQRPLRRAKHAGYRRNTLVALGNHGSPKALPALDEVAQDSDPMIRDHASWAIDQITRRARQNE